MIMMGLIIGSYITVQTLEVISNMYKAQAKSNSQLEEVALSIAGIRQIDCLDTLEVPQDIQDDLLNNADYEFNAECPSASTTYSGTYDGYYANNGSGRAKGNPDVPSRNIRIIDLIKRTGESFTSADSRFGNMLVRGICDEDTKEIGVEAKQVGVTDASTDIQDPMSTKNFDWTLAGRGLGSRGICQEYTTDQEVFIPPKITSADSCDNPDYTYRLGTGECCRYNDMSDYMDGNNYDGIDVFCQADEYPVVEGIRCNGNNNNNTSTPTNPTLGMISIRTLETTRHGTAVFRPGANPSDRIFYETRQAGDIYMRFECSRSWITSHNSETNRVKAYSACCKVEAP